MRRKRIQKKMVPKGLQNQERTLDERIVSRQILIVPHERPLQRRRAHGEPNERKYRATYPIAPEIDRDSCD